jgi:hypothetical protein
LDLMVWFLPFPSLNKEYDAFGNKRTLAAYRDGTGWVQP